MRPDAHICRGKSIHGYCTHICIDTPRLICIYKPMQVYAYMHVSVFANDQTKSNQTKPNPYMHRCTHLCISPKCHEWRCDLSKRSPKYPEASGVRSHFGPSRSASLCRTIEKQELASGTSKNESERAIYPIP